MIKVRDIIPAIRPVAGEDIIITFAGLPIYKISQADWVEIIKGEREISCPDEDVVSLRYSAGHYGINISLFRGGKPAEEEEGE